MTPTQPVPYALCDQLTELFIPRVFEEVLHASLFRWYLQPPQLPLGVLIMDADRFVQINSWYGPSVGDELLCVIARTLLDVRPERASVYRVGGDKFALLIPGCDDPGSLAATIQRRVLEDTRGFLATQSPIVAPSVIGSAPRTVAVSIGAASIAEAPRWQGVRGRRSSPSEKQRFEADACCAAVAAVHGALSDAKRDRSGGYRFAEPPDPKTVDEP
jgi:diguanylate cyclase (GGDEF)-like protein